MKKQQSKLSDDEKNRVRLAPFIGKKVKCSKGVAKLVRISRGFAMLQFEERIPGNLCAGRLWNWPMDEVEPANQRSKIRYYKK